MLPLLICALTVVSDPQAMTLFSGAAGQPVQQPGPPGQPATPSTAPPAGTSTVRGHVFAADSGQPLRKAQVRLMSSELRENRLASTDVEGGYEFREVRAGRYNISANKGSYVGLSYGQERSTDAPKPIAILDNQTVERMDFSLPRGGVITGRILDEYGEPMSDVQVAAEQYQVIQGQRRLVPNGRQGSTNDIGEFRLFGIAPGQYYLVATWRSTNPMNNQDKVAYAPTYYPGTENAAQAQRVTLAAGQELSDLVLQLKPLGATRVSGTVAAADGRPMAGYVMVLSTGGFGFSGVAGAPIRPDGTFTINGLAPGEYTLRAQSNGMPSDDSEAGVARITATGDDIADVHIVAAKASTLSGRIVIDPALATALPATLQLMLSPTDPGMMRMGFIPPRLSGDGTFELKSGPGRMRINAVGAPGWVIRNVRLNGADITDAGIDFKPGEDIAGVEVELTNKVTVISGLVSNARGETVKDYSALAFSQDRDKWKVAGRYQGTGRPDQDGRFKISGLPPGDYYVIALDKIEPGRFSDPDFLETIRTKATAITIQEGETRTLELRIAGAI
ncbi:MAG: carboxypeptidase regulatory-like domain-containing protein [Vicinamibacterales bacterium]